MTNASTTAGSSGRRRGASPRRRRLITGGAIAGALAAALGLGVALAQPSLQDQINSARSSAGQLSARVSAQTARIVSLTEQAHQAGAQAMVANAQLQRAEARSRELAAKLAAAQQQLDRLRAQYAAAVKTLDQRLVAIYESDPPDNVSVVLNSNGYDDLATRTAYLQALHDADQRIAHEVATLRNQVAAHVKEVTELKQESDAQAAQLASERASFEAAEAAANRAAAAVAQARAATQESLAKVNSQVEQLVAEQAAQRQAASGAPAFLGGPYAIPTYIVMCESGGNYHALNQSSGAGGAYQILPSTWHAYGGQGAPQDAPKAEQDRIAAEIWRDSGPSAWSCG
jgi:peptidoglycan hydrolase CwlO-like protein